MNEPKKTKPKSTNFTITAYSAPQMLPPHI